MAQLPPIVDANLYAPKTADPVPIAPGNETITSGMSDFNNLRLRISENRTQINRNERLVVNNAADADFSISDANHAQWLEVLPTATRTITVPMGLTPGTEVLVANASGTFVLNWTAASGMILRGDTSVGTASVGRLFIVTASLGVVF